MDDVVRIQNTNSDKPTLSPYTLPYLRNFLLNLKNNNYSRNTLDHYARDLEIFSCFLYFISLPFSKITKLDIIEYKGFLRDNNYIPILHAFQKGEELTDEVIQKSKTEISERKRALYKGQLSDNSVNRMLSTLRSYLTFLEDMDQVPPIPPSAIKMIKTEKKEKQVAELEDLIKLIEYPSENEDEPIVAARNRAILELIFSTGMRISEAVGLDRDQLRIENNQIVASKIYVMGKGKKQRFVYMTERAIFFLNEYLKFRVDDFPALFIPTKGTRKSTENPYIVRISKNYVQMKIAEYRRRLGIIVPTSAHSLRHGFATYLAEEGANPAAIQRLLGHSSLQTTSRYVHASDKFAEDAHKKFHPLGDKEGQ